MNYNEFNEILSNRMNRIEETLSSKAGEYADGEDRLIQFKRAASLIGNTPLEACLGMAVKHFTSIYELASKPGVKLETWEEKLTDAMCYCVLLEAILKERKEG